MQISCSSSSVGGIVTLKIYCLVIQPRHGFLVQPDDDVLVCRVSVRRQPSLRFQVGTEGFQDALDEESSFGECEVHLHQRPLQEQHRGVRPVDEVVRMVANVVLIDEGKGVIERFVSQFVKLIVEF